VAGSGIAAQAVGISEAALRYANGSLLLTGIEVEPSARKQQIKQRS